MRRRSPFIPAFLAVAVVAAACGGSPESPASYDQAVSARPTVGSAGADVAAPAPLSGFTAQGDGERQAAQPALSARVAAAPPAQGPSGVTVPSQAVVPGAMLIRAGQAVVEVDSMEVAIARVRRLAQETGALVANTSVQSGREQQRSASLELRIPSDRFDAVVNGLSPIGRVESVNISAQDVGEEFVDLTARVANARRLEARLIELLANRTGRLTDVLSVERELARVREEIERYEGRLRYLQSRVSVSSLTVVVHEPPPVVARHPGENIIADAFIEAWRRFVWLTAGLIASLGVLVPVGALGFGAYVLGRRYLAHKSTGAREVAG